MPSDDRCVIVDASNIHYHVHMKVWPGQPGISPQTRGTGSKVGKPAVVASEVVNALDCGLVHEYGASAVSTVVIELRRIGD